MNKILYAHTNRAFRVFKPDLRDATCVKCVLMSDEINDSDSLFNDHQKRMLRIGLFVHALLKTSGQGDHWPFTEDLGSGTWLAILDLVLNRTLVRPRHQLFIISEIEKALIKSRPTLSEDDVEDISVHVETFKQCILFNRELFLGEQFDHLSREDVVALKRTIINQTMVKLLRIFAT